MKALPAPDRATRRIVGRAKEIPGDTLAIVVIGDARFLCSTVGNWRLRVDSDFVRDLNAALKELYEANLESVRPDSPTRS